MEFEDLSFRGLGGVASGSGCGVYGSQQGLENVRVTKAWGFRV